MRDDSGEEEKQVLCVSLFFSFIYIYNMEAEGRLFERKKRKKWGERLTVVKMNKITITNL